MAKTTVEQEGKITLAGRQVDALLTVLHEAGYAVELKQIKPEDERVAVALQVQIRLERSLFDGKET